MSLNVSWEQFKNYLETFNGSPQYIEDANQYLIYLFNGPFSIHCTLEKNGGAEVLDFESNYKSKSNYSLMIKSLPFSEKILSDGKKLFRRVRGTSGTVQNNPVNIDFTIPFNQCKITGLQIIGAKLGDKATFQVLDTPQGTISGVPNAILNTFGEDVYITPDSASYPSKYDADLINGLVLRIIYDATDELLPRNIYINFDLHEVVS